MKLLFKSTVLALLVAVFLPLCPSLQAQTSAGLNKQLFSNPPNAARPRLWWHWMNGNITEEGIRLDLEWMHKIGVGGFQQFDAGINTPQVVEKRLPYMTPEWKSAFRFAIETADKFGMEATIASSPGWSETGGPWVPPADAMKKLVWSEIHVRYGQALPKQLPSPPATPGVFQDCPRSSTAKVDDFYRDVAVLAYPTPPDATMQSQTAAKITVSNGQVDPAALSDGRIGVSAATIRFDAAVSTGWIQFEYPQPTRIQAVSLATLGDTISPWAQDNPPSTTLSSSEDGIHFDKIADLPRSTIPQRTASFPARTAKYYRLTFLKPVPKPGSKSASIQISELVFYSAARVNRFEEKAGFATNANYYAVDTPDVDKASVVPGAKVLNLTSRMRPDGTLDWTAPHGNWTILRIGYSLTGKENAPAPPEATGLEADKLDAGSVRRYMEKYLSTYRQSLPPELMGKHGVEYMLTDSIEAGSQNWTGKMLEEFKVRRGYDPRPWLPVLTGVIIDGAQQSDRFLWDYRQTIAELLAQNHYGTIAAFLHENGLKIYGEALESHRPNLGDDIDMRRYTDVPVGALWTYAPGHPPVPSHIVDIRGASSIAHVYGQNLVGVESMTSGGPAWSFAPSDLKPIVDLQFLLGANRILYHESAHQPLVDKAPGLTLGQYGQWFNRNETWAEEAKPWIDYLSRSCYMLQSGRGYADIAYFYGEEGPLTGLYGGAAQTDAPENYGFDFVNATMLRSVLSVKDHRIVAPSGASFRVLYLGGRSQRMTLSVLLRLKELLEAGAIVVGEKPLSSPSFSDNDAEFQKLTNSLWGAGKSASGMRRIGQGELWQGMDAIEVLRRKGVQPDFTYDKTNTDTDLRFLHRRLSDGDVYFVSNRMQREEDTWVALRVDGKNPELWHADTGLTEPVSYETSKGLTRVHLHLAPNDAVFVVFKQPSTQSSLDLPVIKEETLTVLPEDWLVTFQPGRGAPAQTDFAHLASWSENSDAGIKYFSGHATYSRMVNAPKDWVQGGQRIWLDLGEVDSLAEVSVNGNALGVVWKNPFRVEITDALHVGANQISVTVTNLWVNRLIGDQQKDATKTYTFTTQHPYTANSPLQKSGLLGPVKIIRTTQQN